jgi:hypothetical protein
MYSIKWSFRVCCCVLAALPQGVVRAALTSAKPVQDEGLQLLRQLLPQVMASAEQVHAVKFSCMCVWLSNGTVFAVPPGTACCVAVLWPRSTSSVCACTQRLLQAGPGAYQQPWAESFLFRHQPCLASSNQQ